MRSATMAWVLCLVVSGQITRLQADELDSLSPGTRLRVTAPAEAPRRIVGTLTAVDAHSLTIHTSSQFFVVPREAIETLEVSERRSLKKRGALYGAGAGVIAALIAAAVDEQKPFCLFGEPCSADPYFSRQEVAVLAAILFVPVGTTLGAVIAPGERWVAVKPPTRGAARTQSCSGIQVGINLRF